MDEASVLDREEIQTLLRKTRVAMLRDISAVITAVGKRPKKKKSRRKKKH
jgi:hypothetical protein